ncbi:formate dehydrogenase accessory sulfurtransferase FdhD [Chitinasiproducens palmae]|nr:formate dehydrogenase accessory sulfurtransferase FdhD [Chitinasiproducens palmae]
MNEAGDRNEPSAASAGGWQPRAAIRHRRGEVAQVEDRLAEETPVALVYNGISHAVMMATPLDLEQLAVGFSLSEGIIARAGDILDVDVVHGEEAAEVHITLLQAPFMALKAHRRALAGRTGCGVCGIESIQLLDLHAPPLARAGACAQVDAAAIARAAAGLPAHQQLMRATGGVHAAAWCELDGTIRFAYEDVGRHNALDKLIGRLVEDEQDTALGFVFMSSRASYELVRKSARVGVTMLATISAPSSLAVRIAGEAGMRLVSFCRNDGFVEYVAGGAPVVDAQPAAVPR